MTQRQAQHLGRLVQKARQAKGLTLRDIEDQTGISFAWVYQLERGTYQQPAPERLARLAELLDIDPERIDRLSRGQVSAALPTMRTYLRTKYDMTTEDIARVEKMVSRIRQQAEADHERPDSGTGRSKPNQRP